MSGCAKMGSREGRRATIEGLEVRGRYRSIEVGG